MLKDHFHSRLDGCNVGIVEGVMGLYDGFEGTLTGSTADLARTLEIPVILLVDCKGLSASVAPIVHGFRTFRSDVQIAGVILNRTGSERHVRYLKEALAPLDIPVIGHLPRNEDLALEHRHLGLFAAQHGDATEEKIGNIADAVEKTVDLDLLMKICVEVETCTLSAKCKSDPPKRTCRIAVARDAAFHFYYQANLDMLQAAGAELVFFSPLKDTALPCGIDGLLLGGGYPEEHSVELSGNMTIRSVTFHLKTAVSTQNAAVICTLVII
jgi:cobyrinic acid a,c-diamide synthase